jgi:hypothetical protein
MKTAASNILATVSLGLLLSGVNELNPYQYQSLGACVLLGWISYRLSS